MILATNPLALLQVFDFRSFHTYGLSWVTAGDNGGIGTLRAYVDGVLKASCDYSQRAPPSCARNLPAGTFYDLDHQQNTLIFGAYSGTGGNPPMTIQSVEIWMPLSG